MTIHVLIPCSKTKEITPPEELIWTPKKELNKWNKAWNDGSLKNLHQRCILGVLYSSKFNFVSNIIM